MRGPYADAMLTTALRSLWNEPRPADPPRRVWRDWVLVGALLVSLGLEAALLGDLRWGAVAIGVSLLLGVALLRRRTDPLGAVAITFVPLAVITLATLTVDPPDIYTWFFVLVLPYALARWGSGRDGVIGLAIMLVTALLSIGADFTGLLDSVLGLTVLLLPAALGASVRFRVHARSREIDQAKLREREQLARELHDTVAHHVTGIAIQAQAGLAVASTHPARAVDALAVIEEAASRTLAELRTTVGALRDSDEAELAPLLGVADLERLAVPAGGWPHVEVERSGALDDLSPAVGAAIYRLAQEAVTNARRHARDATLVTVRVTGGDEAVYLTVEDDGAPGTAGGNPPGFGLIGMSERVALLGGTFEAGPARGRGWRVVAMLPRTGVAAGRSACSSPTTRTSCAPA
jgi:signal transduction histidine kinase